MCVFGRRRRTRVVLVLTLLSTPPKCKFLLDTIETLLAFKSLNIEPSINFTTKGHNISCYKQRETEREREMKVAYLCLNSEHHHQAHQDPQNVPHFDHHLGHLCMNNITTNNTCTHYASSRKYFFFFFSKLSYNVGTQRKLNH